MTKPYTDDLQKRVVVAMDSGARCRSVAAPRSRDTLWRSVGTIFTRFTPDECANHLNDAGFASVQT